MISMERAGGDLSLPGAAGLFPLVGSGGHTYAGGAGL